MKQIIIKKMKFNKHYLILFLVLSLCIPFVLADRNIFSGVINTTSNISLINLVYPINNTNFNNNIIFALNPNNPSSIINGSYTLNCSTDYTDCNLTNSTFNQVYNYESEDGILSHNPSFIWNNYEAVYHFNLDGLNSQLNASRDLTLNNASIINGRIGKGVKLYGTEISNMTTLNIPFQPRVNYTISLWFKRDGDGYNHDEGINMTAVFGEGNDGNPKYRIQIPSYSTNNFRFRVMGINCDSIINVSNNVWYHLIAVQNGTSIILYVNGVKECSKTLTGGSDLENTRDLVFGDDNGNFNYCNCTIDEFRYTYNVFNEQQAKAEYELMQYAYSPIINKTIEISIIPETPEITGYNETYNSLDLGKITIDIMGKILILILSFCIIIILVLLVKWFIGKRKG